jgi:superkiller protein 8
VSGDKTVKVWDAKAQDHPLLHTFQDAHRLGAHHVVVDINSGGTVAASSGFGQEVVLWDLAECKEKLRLNPKGSDYYAYG